MFHLELNDSRKGGAKSRATPSDKRRPVSKTPDSTSKPKFDQDDEISTDIEDGNQNEDGHDKDGFTFETFQKICDSIAATSSHLEKTAILRNFLEKNKKSSIYLT